MVLQYIFYIICPAYLEIIVCCYYIKCQPAINCRQRAISHSKWCKYWAGLSELGVPQVHPQILTDQLTLSHGDGQIMLTTLPLPSPPRIFRPSYGPAVSMTSWTSSVIVGWVAILWHIYKHVSAIILISTELMSFFVILLFFTALKIF